MGKLILSMKGQAFGNYIVREKIGEGGMGEIFLAEHRRMGRKAAIKVLRAHGCANPHDVERFFNEARAVSMIDHPGVVQIFDCDFHENGAYLTMEYLEGESLAAMIRRANCLSTDPESIRLIGTQIASVLAAAHAKGIVHRDLKPDNVFLENKRGGTLPFLVRILDFGIAKLIAADAAGLTKTGMVLGTPAYMAPEQCAGDRDVDTRADIYSLGCILFEMAAGSPPFVRAGVGSLITAHMSEPPPSVAKAWTTAPAGFASLVAQMLAKDPAERPQTMVEVESRLHDSLSLSIGRSTLSLPATDGSSVAATVLLATHKLPAVETQIEPQALMEPKVWAASPTAVLPGSEDYSPEPMASLPTGNRPRTGEQSGGMFKATANGRLWSLVDKVKRKDGRLWSLVDKVKRKRVSLIVAAGVVAIGLAMGVAGSRRKAPSPASFRPTEAPAEAVAPARTETAQPRVAPEEAVPPRPTIPAPAGQASPSLPSIDTSSIDTPPAAPESQSARKRSAAAAEEGRDRGRSTVGTKGRSASKRRIDAKAQPKKEIRGFSDF